MYRLRLPLSLALVCVLVAIAMPAAASARTPAKRMIDGVNWWRAHVGPERLYVSRNLTRSSRRRARRLIRRDYFAHPSRLRVPGFDRVGEVLALHGGWRLQLRRTLRAWDASSGHRRVVLSRSYSHIGAGRATGWCRGRRATIWVVRLGTK